MFCIQNAFVQATYSVTTLAARIFIHPLSPSLGTPTGESWKTVNDKLFAQVPSSILLEMTMKELNREMKGIGLENISGWIFNSDRTLDVSQLMERYSLRYTSLSRGIFADELMVALDRLFTEDPRFQGRLSACDDKKEAVEDVTRRVLAQLRFTWELDRIQISDASALGVRLMVEFQDVLYRRLDQCTRDAYLMPATRFKRYEYFYEKMVQFRGLDARFDRVLADYHAAIALFPDDGRSLFGTKLDDFWARLQALGAYLTDELQKDLFDESSVYDEDLDNLCGDIEDALLADIVLQELTPTDEIRSAEITADISNECVSDNQFQIQELTQMVFNF